MENPQTDSISNKTYRVAILLAAYNGEKWLSQQVLSILNQKKVNIKLFISLDKSGDKSLSILKNFEKQYINVEIISYDKIFGSACKNFLNIFQSVNVDNFDYIALSDQDDIWMQEKLFQACEKLENNSFDCYSSNVYSFSTDVTKKYLVDKCQDQTPLDFFYESGGPGCTYVLSKRSFLFLQKFLEGNIHSMGMIDSHDWFIYALLRFNRFKWYMDKNSYILYRQHEQNVLGSNVGLRAAISRMKLILNKWYSNQIYAISTVVQGLDASQYVNKIFILQNILKTRRRSRDRFFLAISVIFFLF